MTVFRHICNACAQGGIHSTRLNRFAFQPDFACRRLHQPDYGIRDSGAARAAQPDQTNALARTYGKAYILHRP